MFYFGDDIILYLLCYVKFLKEMKAILNSNVGSTVAKYGEYQSYLFLFSFYRISYLFIYYPLPSNSYLSDRILSTSKF